MTTEHVAQCPLRVFGQNHSDAARRLSDAWNLHRIGVGLYNAIGKWYAIRLDDGSSDGVLYDSKSDAIRHQRGMEWHYAYVCMSLAQMNPCDAEIYLGIQRRMYSRGIRMTDPDARNGGPDVIKRTNREDMQNLLYLRGSNILIPGKDF